MKNWLIAILIIWIISIPVIIIVVNDYIEIKDNRLRSEFRCAVMNIFSGREYIDVVYSGKKVSYEKKTIPERPKKCSIPQDAKSIELYGDLDKEFLSNWVEKYGDLYKIYRIKNDRKEWDVPYKEEDGWQLIKMRLSDDSILVQQWIFPYAVGYKRQDYYFSYDYAPSVRSAVNETFDFFTSDPKSNMYKDFEKGSCNRIFHDIYEANNEYYTIIRNSNPKIWQVGETLWEDWDNANREIGESIGSPMKYTYMHNYYYRVFVGLTQPTTWSIERCDWAVESDRTNILKWWLISSGSFFAIIIIFLSISLYRKNKRIYESDYKKLLRLSHPKNFMNPYDKDKIEKANFIYKEVEAVNDDNSDAVNVLIQRCIDELGISFIDPIHLSELKKLVNPKRFMNPYDAQKVQLANQLFSILNLDNLSFADFKEVCNKAKILDV